MLILLTSTDMSFNNVMLGSQNRPLDHCTEKWHKLTPGHVRIIWTGPCNNNNNKKKKKGFMLDFKAFLQGFNFNRHSM